MIGLSSINKGTLLFYVQYRKYNCIFAECCICRTIILSKKKLNDKLYLDRIKKHVYKVPLFTRLYSFWYQQMVGQKSVL